MKNPLTRIRPAKKAAGSERKAMLAKARSLIGGFIADLPHEAHAGSFNFGIRDKWHGKKLGIFDGWYKADDWAVRIQGGRPVEAVRSDNPQFPTKYVAV